MIGTDRRTGKLIEGIAHMRQSLEDLLTTPKGTRIMRADYGSDLPRLVDMPVNSELILDIMAETAGAIEKWEPRFKVTNVRVTSLTVSQVILTVSGRYLPDGKEITIEGIVVK